MAPLQQSLGLRLAALAASACALSAALAQPPTQAAAAYGLEPGERAVGFRLIEAQDASRAVTAGHGSATHPRPLRVYVWYPAARAAQPMRFDRYAELADGDIWPAEIAGAQTEKLRYANRPLARSLGADFTVLLRQPVLAVENARPLDGPFPLIVLGVGLYYESPVSFAALAEYLAGRGFVVASTPLNGTNSPVSRIVEADLETQVRDLEQVIARARELPFVSRDTLGVLGFDVGGMAGLILSMRSVDVDAYASIGSGILFEHPSGLPRTAHGYDPLALRVPWFHADRAQNATAPPPNADQESLFAQATRSDRYLLLIESMDHFDFTSDALIAGPAAMAGYWPPSTPARAASSATVARYVHGFFAAALEQDADSRAFLAQAPDDSIPGRKVTIEHRTAVPGSITYEQFIEAVVAGRAAEAIGDLRAAAEAEPNHLMLQQPNLDRAIVSLLFTWGLARETIPVIEFMGERYPSPRSLGLLSQAYVLAGDTPAAIDALTRLGQQYPNAAAEAQRQIAALRARSP